MTGAKDWRANLDTKFWWSAGWCAILLLGAALRLLRLSWQPLWWDEGYSLFFATEPLPTMLALTAQDIHPPLYYTLLHGWFALLGHTGPEAARLFSALVGIATLPLITWASLTLWPRRDLLSLLATLLLAISPVHLYYSQEVRMYGLALLFTLLASVLLWKMQQQLTLGQRPIGVTIGYVIFASLALLTLYYTGFLLLAHQLWTLATNRRHLTRQRWFVGAALCILLIQLPWWLYALPKLFGYVADKVLADQDTPLPLWSYLWRHWLAFFTGNLVAPWPWLEVARNTIAAGIALLLAISMRLLNIPPDRTALRGLLSLIALPVLIGFGVNLTYPFFPDGGERLLLQVLPYLLLLMAYVVVTRATTYPVLATLTLALPLVASAIGIYTFFTVPRYVEHDYRPIIADIAHQGRDQDTVLALFPWQVGYWRAYSPRNADGSYLAPQPPPVDQTILRWGDPFATRLDDGLTRGTIWFPMPVSFGSTLPDEIETYLKARSRNLENRWYTPATRLTAWTHTDDSPIVQPLNADFAGQVVLHSGGASPAATSANTPIAVDLCWQPSAIRTDLRASLRLVDSENRVWASRDLTPLAAFANLGENVCLEQIALNIPVGLPPARYTLLLGVGPETSDQLFTPTTATSSLITLSTVDIAAPTSALSPYRLGIAHPLATPLEDAGILLLGYSGPDAEANILVGDEMALMLYFQSISDEPPTRQLYVSLLDPQGNGVAGGENWSLPYVSTAAWTNGTLARLPVHFFLPPDLAAGQYTLIAGFIDPDSATKGAPATLGRVQLTRRPTKFTRPTTQFQVSPPVELGTHANLVGYDVAWQATTLQISLVWQIEQPLLPPHHVFVHLFDANGTRLAQSDGEPMTASGRAPSGSWLPGEYLTTYHTFPLPASVALPLTVQAGLYLPTDGQRLPANVNGTIIGDSIPLNLPAPP